MELSVSHRRMVRFIAHKYSQRLPSHVEVDDLIQVGLIALWKAQERYEPQVGIPFEQYVRQRIQGAMANDHLSRNQRESRRAITNATNNLRVKLHRNPTQSEIAKELSMTIVEFQTMVREYGTDESFELTHIADLFNPNDEGGHYDYLDCHKSEQDESIYARLESPIVRSALEKAFDKLNDRERNILTMYFDDHRTHIEISKIYGVTASRISMIQDRAVQKLQLAMREH